MAKLVCWKKSQPDMRGGEAILRLSSEPTECNFICGEDTLVGFADVYRDPDDVLYKKWNARYNVTGEEQVVRGDKSKIVDFIKKLANSLDCSKLRERGRRKQGPLYGLCGCPRR